ncbi:DUF2255 family protein [Streptomyces albipurpureus]|uniref:DUF2255 family protein n=1 Tax=Streptomyces albipurpureus TaxID=2897419 RepID=A0ABT0UFM2_9ACTN|nr:DUF2255 family protein [Streptomyces sp. CWNU-1]MCM2387194.1 DUF2255 family protein [Streptomyces sp. CWNU-1]
MQSVTGMARSSKEIFLHIQHAGASVSRTVWCVDVGGSTYIRSAFGPNSQWYRMARLAGTARVEIDGTAWPVRLELTVEPGLNHRISEAYRAKYERAWPGPVRSLLSADAVGTTLRLRPHTRT